MGLSPPCCKPNLGLNPNPNPNPDSNSNSNSEAGPNLEPAAPVNQATIRLARMTGARGDDPISLVLAPRATLGRAPDCDLRVTDDAEVSSRHAQLEALSNGRVALRDLGSTNGTRLNGIVVQGIHPVGEGDVIAVGQTEFRVLR